MKKIELCLRDDNKFIVAFTVGMSEEEISELCKKYGWQRNLPFKEENKMQREIAYMNELEINVRDNLEQIFNDLLNFAAENPEMEMEWEDEDSFSYIDDYTFEIGERKYKLRHWIVTNDVALYELKSAEDMLYEIYNKAREIIKHEFYVNENGGIEIYTDYRNRELSTDFLRIITNNEDNLEQSFIDCINEWAIDYEANYGLEYVEEVLKRHLTEEEYEIIEKNDFNEFWAETGFYFYYNINDFNQEVNVNIMIDCGNGNYDFTKDNIVNWYGHQNFKFGEINDLSSILWLAQTQDREPDLRNFCLDYYEDEELVSDNKFVQSCIEELENLNSHMGTVTFLVKMPILDILKLIDRQDQEVDYTKRYTPHLDTKSKSYLVIDKNVDCGLYDSCNGTGSCLEIQLEKDVKLPLKYCMFCIEGCEMHGYDVNYVYGLIDDCWKPAVKEVVIKD